MSLLDEEDYVVDNDSDNDNDDVDVDRDGGIIGYLRERGTKRMNERKQYDCWLKKGDHLLHPSDNVKVIERLDSGTYHVSYDEYNDVFSVNKRPIKTDELIDVPQAEAEDIMKSIDDFYTQKEEFEKWGFLFKRGFLLYGVPGGGKTSIIARIIDYVVTKLDGLIFTIYNRKDLHAYSKFLPDILRTIEPNRIVISVFEDIDGMVDQSETETLLINILDGLGNSGNVFNIATTNYMERLSPRIMNRPNRFDRRFEIKPPDAVSRKFFLSKRIRPEFLTTIDLEDWVTKTEGMTLAQLGEVIKSVFLLKKDFNQVIDTLFDMRKVHNSADYGKINAELGFSIKK